MKLYHGTNTKFDKPRFTNIQVNEGRHINGCLGLWCAKDLELSKLFGTHVLTVEITGTPFRMGISELSRLEADRDIMEDFRAKLIKAGYDYIDVVEQDHSIAMSILLHDAAITNLIWD